MTTPEISRSTPDVELRAPLADASPRAEIAAGNARFMDAFRAGDADAVTACYTADAQLLPAGSDAISGAEAITAFWRAGMEAGIADVRLETVEVERYGDAAVEVGRYTLRAADGGSIDHGKYLVVWRRAEGGWRLHRDIWTTSVAPQSS